MNNPFDFFSKQFECKEKEIERRKLRFKIYSKREGF